MQGWQVQVFHHNVFFASISDLSLDSLGCQPDQSEFMTTAEWKAEEQSLASRFDFSMASR